MVTFHRLDENRTRVMVQLDFLPEGIKEKVRQLQGSDRATWRGGRVLTRRSVPARPGVLTLEEWRLQPRGPARLVSKLTGGRERPGGAARLTGLLKRKDVE